MRPGRFALVWTFALVAVFALASVGAEASSRAPARITSVTFTGSPSNPVVTIVGSGLGTRPQPSPSYKPTPPHGNVAPYGCTTTGNVGYDYGTRLWLADSAGSGWSAGRYRPGIHELDCVGLLIVGYSPTKVVYRLGADYRAHGYRLNLGDHYEASVNGGVKRGTVRYG